VKGGRNLEDGRLWNILCVLPGKMLMWNGGGYDRVYYS